MKDEFDDSTLDYDFDFGGTTQRVKHDYASATIVNSQGHEWVTIENRDFNLWPDKEAMPKIAAICALLGYFQGTSAGHLSGYQRCQREMRKLLGVE